MIDRDPPETPSIVTAAVLCEGGLLVLAIGMGWFMERGPLAQLAGTGGGVGYGLAATVPLLLALVVMTTWPVGPLKRLEVVASQIIVPLFSGCAWWQLLLISILAGLGEEALFRGVIQMGVQQWTASPAWALVIASVLFGLAHPITWLYAVLAGLIGAYLGWLLLATDNLLVPVVTHAAYDFVAIVYLVRRGADIDSPIVADADDDFGVV